MEDPFTFCFSDRRVRAPEDSGVAKAVHQSVKDFLLCDTYFVNGTRRQSVHADDRVYGMVSGDGWLRGWGLMVDDWKYNSTAFGEMMKAGNGSLLEVEEKRL